MTWTRATGAEICGACSQALERGAPKKLRLNGVLVRCASCAGEPVPSDLPALEHPPSTTSTPAAHVARPLTPIGKLVNLPFDGRMAAAGRDDA